MSDLFCSRSSILRPAGAAILVTALSMTGACASSAKQVAETTPQSSAHAAGGGATPLAANRSEATGSQCRLEAVYYDTDSADLDEAARNALDQNAACLRADPKRGAGAVVGMTDPRGTEEYNIALGDRRARAAAGYVAALGVDGQRLRAHSVGEEYASGTDEALWGRDRRSEFKQE